MNEIAPTALRQEIASTPDAFEIEKFQPISPENLQSRIDTALEQTEFAPTPEVKEAIGGFYSDHYELSSLVSSSLDLEKEQTQDFREQNTDTNTPHALQRQSELLLRAREDYDKNPDDRNNLIKLIQQAASSADMAFVESGIGVTTIGDEEIKIREQLGNQVLEFAQDHDMLWMFLGRAGSNDPSKLVHGLGVEHKIFYGRQLDEDQIEIRKDKPRVEAVEGSVKFNGDIAGDGFAFTEIQLSEHMKTGRIDRAKKEFWNDVRQASHLEFHGTATAGALMVDGALSRNEQVKHKGHYRTGNAKAVGGKHHTNVVKFSEFMPSGEYTGYSDRSDDGEIQYSPGTYGIPIADIIEVAPFARNAEFTTVTAKAETSTELQALVDIPVVDKKIGPGATEHVGSSPKTSLQRGFFASPEEGGEIAPDEYKIELSGTGDSGKDPASSTRALFIFEDSSWPVAMGYQMPSVYRIGKDNRSSNVEIVKTAQQKISEHPKFKNKFVIPMRRGVFSFVPEESDHKEYEHAEQNTYTQVARSAGSLAVAS